MVKGRIKRILAKSHLVRARKVYKHGEIEVRDAIFDPLWSWVLRSFIRDRYTYIVSSISNHRNHRGHQGKSDGYMIERIGRVPFLSESDAASPPRGHSGLDDDERGLQDDPMKWTNERYAGERSALTIYGYWLGSYPSGYANPDSSASSKVPFDSVPIPDCVRIFETEEEAYAYLPSVTGERIPAKVRHFAWLAIALSTFLWQWHDKF